MRPNFLAYNSIATFANGEQVGVTDTMSFAADQREVAFNVGQGIGDPEQFFAYAFDELGNLVDSYLETPDSNALIAIALSGPGIRSVQYGLVDGTGTFVVDDLSLTAVSHSGRPAAVALGPGRAGCLQLAAETESRHSLTPTVSVSFRGAML